MKVTSHQLPVASRQSNGVLGIAFCLLATGYCLLTAGQSDSLQRVIVCFKRPPTRADCAAIHALQGTINCTYRLIPAVAASLPRSAVAALQANPRVAYIEPDYLHTYVGHKREEVWWGVREVGGRKVWKKFKVAGEGVRVAVLDSGADARHPDLRFAGGVNFAPPGRDGSTRRRDWKDEVGHGTFVSGIIRARHNGRGVVGVAFRCQLFMVKVGDPRGVLTSDAIQGLEWAVENKMHIVNMSWGAEHRSRALKEACDAAYDGGSGTLLVAAAGNEGDGRLDTDEFNFPAGFSSVIAVGATEMNERLAHFSNTNPKVELSAPGVFIRSTLPGNRVGVFSGTSLSAPHVSGAAALVFSAGQKVLGRTPTAGEVRQILQQTAHDIGPEGRDNGFGFGLVRADRAVKWLLASGS